MPKKIAHASLVFALLLGFSLLAPVFSTYVNAASTTIKVELGEDPTQKFNRPLFPHELNDGLSFDTVYAASDFEHGVSSESYNYLIRYFKPTWDGQYSIIVTEATLEQSDSGQDTALFLYTTHFDPAQPLENLMFGNDNIDSSEGNDLSQIPNATLTTGTTYIVVLTSSYPQDTGEVEIRVYGPGTVQYQDQPFETPPAVATSAVASKTSNSASVGGEVTADGGSAITERGVVYATTPSPTVSDGKVSHPANTTGAFTVEFTELTPETTYYYRAYAKNAMGTSYGNDQTFTTDAAGPTPLGQAANMDLSSEGVASWDAVPNATGYEVQLYKENSAFGDAVAADTTSLNVLAAMRNGGAGAYTVKVKAKGDGTIYSDGPESDASPARTILQPAAVSDGLTWDGRTAKWTTVTNAVSYDVQLYKDGTAVGSAVNVLAADAAEGVDFSASIRDNGGGSYTYTVKALGNATLILDAAESDASAQMVVSTVTYHGNGNTGGTAPVDDQLYEADAAVVVLGNTGNLTKSGYTFAGWNTQADGTGSTYTEGQTFAMGQENVVLYAQWRAASGGGSAPNPPTSQIIYVPIETGDVGSGVQVAQTPITRTTAPDGSIKDETTLTLERAKEASRTLAQSGQHTVRIVMPDQEDAVSQADIHITIDAAKELGDHGIDLEIYTENARIIVPNQSIDNFGEDLYFRLVPVKEETKQQDIGNRVTSDPLVKVMQQGQDGQAHVISRPMTIETNMQNRLVTIILPLLDIQVPGNEEERNQLNRQLYIFIEHSDGEKELLQGKLVEYKDGQFGIEFEVSKFSTFAILRIEGAEAHEAYVKGYEDGTFRPDQSVTRAELAVMLARNLGYDLSQNASGSPFRDVPASHWASGAIAFIQQQGLMVGDHNADFNPDAAITRAELATIVARYKDLALPSTEESGTAFSDLAGHWAARAIAASKQSGILHGYEDGTFRPSDEVTRAEAVKAINRMFDRGPLYGAASPTFKDVPSDHWAFHEIEEAARNHFFTARGEGGEEIAHD